MSLTIYTQANFYYNSYALTNSKTYQENAVDSTKISQDSYHIADMTSALEALDTGDSVDYDFLGNVNSYAKNLYVMSQLNFFDDVSSSAAKISDILSNDRDLSGMYSMMGSSDLISEQYYDYILDNTDSDVEASSDTASSYSDYLNSGLSGSVLDSSA